MNCISFVSLVFAVYARFVEGHLSCYTPDGVAGTCKSIYDCKPLIAVVNKKNRTLTEVEFLRKSQCGFEGTTPAVCCPVESVSQPGSDKVAQNDCTTPHGESAKCIEIHQCSHIIEMIKAHLSPENKSFIQKSRCSGPAKYSVCCGTKPSAGMSTQGGGSCKNTISAYPPDPSTGCCGVDSQINNKRIIYGGAVTDIDWYPWLVLIAYHKDGVDKHLCGGVLISGRYVLTAAHCVTGIILQHGTPRIVRLGEFDVSRDGPDCVADYSGGLDCTDDVLNIPIESVTPHPEYEPDSPWRRNDIALIRLKNLAPYTDFIKPICLPQVDLTLNFTSNDYLFVAGWGLSTTHSSSDVKVHVVLPFVSAEQCQVAYDAPGRKIQLWDKQVCAGGVKGKDSCKGDFGGPLMFEHTRFYEAIGVVSFGPTLCGTDGVPGIYTKVFDYKDWILSNIKP